MKNKLKKIIPARLYAPFLPAYHWLRAVFANIRYGFPAKKLEIIGVTGTNGKTTTVTMIGSVLEASGHKVGVLSTAMMKIGNQWQPNDNSLTTDDVFVLQKHLKHMLSVGITHVVLEVSSHSISQNRIWGIPFAGAVFTNLTQDHLDYHKSMDEYAAVKLKLLKKAKNFVVINGDDAWFDFFNVRGSEMTTVYGTTDKANVRVRGAQITNHGSRTALSTPNGKLDIMLKITGKFNVYNAMAAVGVAQRLKIPEMKIQQGLADLKRVPGRMEHITSREGLDVIVDYAHTTDALTNVLENLRHTTKGKIITVLGATGDRDKSKRLFMGKVVAQLSDVAIITDDDIYTEKSADIRKELLKGANMVVHGAIIHEIPNRRTAIKKSLQSAAKSGDTILLAGIGHQDYLIVEGNKKIDWSESDTVHEELAALDSESKRKSSSSKKASNKSSRKTSKKVKSKKKSVKNVSPRKLVKKKQEKAKRSS